MAESPHITIQGQLALKTPEASALSKWWDPKPHSQGNMQPCSCRRGSRTPVDADTPHHGLPHPAQLRALMRWPFCNERGRVNRASAPGGWLRLNRGCVRAFPEDFWEETGERFRVCVCCERPSRLFFQSHHEDTAHVLHGWQGQPWPLLLARAEMRIQVCCFLYLQLMGGTALTDIPPWFRSPCDGNNSKFKDQRDSKGWCKKWMHEPQMPPFAQLSASCLQEHTKHISWVRGSQPWLHVRISREGLTNSDAQAI